MTFLNLSLGELLGLAGAIWGGVIALYLLDRSKRRQMVATLRFWNAADVRTEMKHRRRIQQPWSLLLELLSIALLLLALAGPRLGGGENSGRDHVLVLDTSAWMGARARQGTLMDEARSSGLAYLKSLPSHDRVMLVRADALATPVTAFESNHAAVEEAIRRSQPGASALDLPQAVEFASRAQKLQGRQVGEIVLVTAGRVPEEDQELLNPPKNLRVIGVASPQENIGLRKIGLRRSPADPSAWEVFVAVRNYGARPHDTDLMLAFGGSPAGSKRLSLPPGAEQQATFTYRARSAGWLEARIDGHDAFSQDDRAVVELPGEKPLRVAIFTAQPGDLKPLFSTNPLIEPVFAAPASYSADVKADIVVLDGFNPPARPLTRSIWIAPPASGSPIAVRDTLKGAKLDHWHNDVELGVGLHTKDVQLDSTEIFSTAAGDIVIGEANDGPAVVARPGTPKMVVFGFEPLRSAMKYELAAPLLVANVLRWMAPEAFRQREVLAQTVGTVTVPVEHGVNPEDVRVIGSNLAPLPFTIEDDQLRFFSGSPGTVNVVAGDREMTYSLTLPDVGAALWKAPPSARHGVPRASEQETAPMDLWPWFALAGGLGLLLDWLLFGRSRAFRLRPVAAVKQVLPWRKAS